MLNFKSWWHFQTLNHHRLPDSVNGYTVYWSESELPILNSMGTSRGSSRMFSRLFLRQQRAGYVYSWPGAWPERQGKRQLGDWTQRTDSCLREHVSKHDGRLEESQSLTRWNVCIKHHYTVWGCTDLWSIMMCLTGIGLSAIKEAFANAINEIIYQPGINKAHLSVYPSILWQWD